MGIKKIAKTCVLASLFISKNIYIKIELQITNRLLWIMEKASGNLIAKFYSNTTETYR